MPGREQRDDELRARADQQNSWAARGDLRGVFGAEGAQLMTTVSPGTAITPPGDQIEVGTVVRTADELTAMLEKMPPCWRYAAFASVAVQRRDAVGSRVRDALMGFSRAGAEVLRTGSETGLFFTERLAGLSELIGQIGDFMISPGFQRVFGDPHDESTADADGIVHAANRLMDYHESLLALSERSRAVRVPLGCADLQRDFGLLTRLPIEGFDSFLDDLRDRVAEMGDVARYATGDVQLDNVELEVTCDEALLGRISQRLQQLTRSN